MRLDYVARPAGTKPAAVYWRRRAVVLGVVLLLVWFAAKACGGSASSPSRAAGSSQSPTAQPLASAPVQAPAGKAPTAAAVGVPGHMAAGKPTGAAASTAPAAVTAMCDGSTISLRAAVDHLRFHRPFTAGITLQIATRSASPCGLDAGALSAQVLDGSRVLWSSAGCPDASAAGANNVATASDGGASPSTSASRSTSASSSTGASPSTTVTGPDSNTNPSASAGTDGQHLITVPSKSAADQHYTWHGNVCSGQLAPGRYDVVGRLGLAQAFAGTVTVS